MKEWKKKDRDDALLSKKDLQDGIQNDLIHSLRVDERKSKRPGKERQYSKHLDENEPQTNPFIYGLKDSCVGCVCVGGSCCIKRGVLRVD